nr:hypothetical protein [uncultured Methanoregula sp.]
MTPQKGECPGGSGNVSQGDFTRPGSGYSGRENEELEWGRRNMGADEPEHRPVTAVFRKTELHGTLSASTPDKKKKIRKRTLHRLNDPDAEVTYQQFESVLRNFVCSLMERQDRSNDEQYLHVAELQQQIDALERRLDTIAKTSPNPSSEEKSG